MTKHSRMSCYVLGLQEIDQAQVAVEQADAVGDGVRHTAAQFLRQDSPPEQAQGDDTAGNELQDPARSATAVTSGAETGPIGRD